MSDVDVYEELWTVWDGVFDESWVVTTPYQYDPVIAEVDEAWREVGGEVQLFRLIHFHPPDYEGECVCVQWAADHRPIRVWG